MRLVHIVAAVTLLCSPAVAMAKEAKKPTLFDAQFKECERETVRRLAVPSQAKLLKRLEHSAQSTSVRLCYEARNQAGGFGTVIGTCTLSPDRKTITEVTTNSGDIAALICAD